MGTMAAALVRLLGAQGQQVHGGVAAMHTSIAGRVFGALGPLGAASRLVHDAVSDSVHGLLRAALGGAGRVGGHLVGRVPDEALLSSPRTVTLVGAVLGLIGDHVRDEEPELAWPTVLLDVDGRVVASTAVSAPPTSATPAQEVVVLLHGLCETELVWRLGSGPGRPPLPDVLAAQHREVLVARMNSGLRVAELGREVAALLAARSGDARVVLVGHSMGGLVARAALRAGVVEDHAWVGRCDELVTLGTPHLGAPLEKAVDVLVRSGARLPEVEAVTRWFDQRSGGIRDLHHGVDDDLEAPGVAVVAAPLPRHVRLHTVGASLPGMAGALLGDGLVRSVSAHGRGVRRPLVARRGEPVDVDGHHFDLVTNPRVTAHVAALLDRVGSPALERT